MRKRREATSSDGLPCSFLTTRKHTMCAESCGHESPTSYNVEDLILIAISKQMLSNAILDCIVVFCQV